MNKLYRGASLRRLTRTALICGASGAALVLAGAPALAADTGTGSSEVVITGSRLRQDGMKTPVPVTVVGSVELEAMSPATLVEGLGQLPQFYNSQTPVAGNWFTRGGYGNLDLRGLGINRTLTLLNGRRVISSTAFGGVDTTLFPSEMVRSVESVTGGASAQYGTDAVAGVVNFILDTKFTGLRVGIQAGETTRNDSRNWQGDVSLGFKLGDRAHILLSAEYAQQEGVHDYKGRDWYQAWGTVPDANGMLLIRPNVVSRTSTFDGLIVAAGSALNGMVFRPDGTVGPFTTSSLSFGNLGAQNARQSITNGGSGDYLGAERNTLYPDLTRHSAFAYGDYQLTDGLTIFAQYINGYDSTFRYNAPRGSLQGSPTAVTIFQDNAFLPDSVRQIMIAEKRPSFTLRRTGSVSDIGADYSLRDTSVLNSATAGFRWDVGQQGLFSGWVVDGYYQYGHSTRKAYQIGLRVDRIFAAIDAVRDPKTGNIVCRTSLFNNTFAGCQPLNLFGRGNASAAAVDYVIGNDVGEQINTPLYFADSGFKLGQTDSYTAQEAKVNITTMQQHVAELTANGEVFKGWGAGPITAAVGGSYRKESIRQIVRDSTNKSSDHTNGHPVLCNSDPAAIAAGLRGVNQPDCTNTVGIQFSKVSNIMGSIDVKEAFVETQVPILADQPWMKLLKVNLAARWADYSGSGSVWAYKGGVDAEIIDGVRLRGTYSRDVRAANLSERFDKTGGFATITDPRYPKDGAVSVTRFSGGNPSVKPEKADTFTAGAVLTPGGALRGLSLSADWYNIKINGAIGQLGTQNVINQCEQGAKDLCALVTRDPTTDRVVLVGDVYVNINKAIVRGVDLEASYHHDVRLIGGDEALSGRVFASWLLENSQQLTGAAKIDRSGQTGIQQSDGVPYSLPRFKATGNVTYTNGPFSMFVQGRYIGAGKIENALVEGKDIERNHVDSAFYTDVRLSYRIDLAQPGGSTQVFISMTNLFDKDPPITPYFAAANAYPLQYNGSLYDILGRRFVVGAKFSF
jgi:iron complex outermembrane receptor protein